MLREELIFNRPQALQATKPPEMRGLARDEVRLMVSTEHGHSHTQFRSLADWLSPSDLLVVNRSATLAASLPAVAAVGSFRLNLATCYGQGLWLAEPRWSHHRPGPLPLEPGETIAVTGVEARMVTSYPGLPRLWFVQIGQDIRPLLARAGEPIRYGYVRERYPLDAYQTVFARLPGSAEMPSAARPFSARVLTDLRKKGIGTASITLHTGVSSLEVETERLEEHPMVPEPISVSPRTVKAVQRTKEAGGRVIAVGTTVVRALESAWNGEEIKPVRGFTRLFVHPDRGVNVVDGLISGFHDPAASHLAMLYAIAGKERIVDAYREAVAQGYLWHEFGDSHLIL